MLHTGVVFTTNLNILHRRHLVCYAGRTASAKGALRVWVKCPEGLYRLDCNLENGVPKNKATVKPRDAKYRLSIEGFGAFWTPKTLKEVNVILAHHGLWPFRDTGELCPNYSMCLEKMNLEKHLKP